MTNKELLEKIARLETELAEVKEMAEEMKKRADGGGAFKPKDGQKYWFISGGEIYDDWWNNFSTYESLYSIGNCFPSRESAEAAVRALKLIQKARESQDGFIPDWEGTTYYKHSLYFDSELKKVRVISNQILDIAPIFGHWEDESACEQFVDENHDELLWFFTEYRR